MARDSLVINIEGNDTCRYQNYIFQVHDRVGSCPFLVHDKIQYGLKCFSVQKNVIQLDDEFISRLLPCSSIQWWNK